MVVIVVVVVMMMMMVVVVVVVVVVKMMIYHPNLAATEKRHKKQIADLHSFACTLLNNKSLCSSLCAYIGIN
jgi:hypothetical protein